MNNESTIKPDDYNLNKSNNYLFIDYAKFIGMVLVIFGHVLASSHLASININFEILLNYITLFHMPLFFIISGFLYKSKDYKSNMDKILYGLLIPCLVYQIICFPLNYGIYTMSTHQPLSTFFKCLIGFVLGDGRASIISFPVCGPCWFIRTIIILRIVCNFINLNIKNIIILTLVSVTILKLLIIFNIDLFFCIDNAVMAIPYFFFGYIIKQKCSAGLNNIKCDKYLSILITLIIVFILPTILKINGFIDMNLKIQPDLKQQSLFLVYLCGILGSFAILKISMIFKQSYKFIDIISKNTLFIIFHHIFILHILGICKYRTLLEFFNFTFIKFILVIIISTFILLTNYYTIIFANKYFPEKINKYLGIRNVT